MKENLDPSVKAYSPPGTKQIVLGESALGANGRRPGVGERTHLSSTVHADFLPIGLYVQGATSDTTIRRIHCGNWRVDGDSSIPALYFATHKTLAELERLAELGEIRPLPWQRFEMVELYAGNRWSIEFEGPLDGVCLWGLAYRDGKPSELVEVREVRGQGGEEGWHEGAVVRNGLSGKQVLLSVKSPTEDGVCRLLGAWSERRGVSI
mgnify:CR=1 FL=1